MTNHLDENEHQQFVDVFPTRNRNNRYETAERFNPVLRSCILIYTETKGSPNSVADDIEPITDYLKSTGCSEIYLFGSAAEGHASDTSDLDFAVRGIHANKFFAIYGEVLNRSSRPVDRVDFENIARELEFIELFLRKSNQNPLDDIEIRAAALSLSTIYNGIQKVIEFALKNQAIPTATTKCGPTTNSGN